MSNVILIYIADLVSLLPYLIPLILVMNLISSMLWGGR